MCTCRRHYFRVAVCTCRCDHIGRHRAPKHRADVAVDNHSEAWPCPLCFTFEPRHRAEVAA